MSQDKRTEISNFRGETMTQTRDLIYDVEDGSMIAVITFETPSSRGKEMKWATVKASLRVDGGDDGRVDAFYMSHEGEATEGDIAYALRCIETNSFAT